MHEAKNLQGGDDMTIVLKAPSVEKCLPSKEGVALNSLSFVRWPSD